MDSPASVGGISFLYLWEGKYPMSPPDSPGPVGVQEWLEGRCVQNLPNFLANIVVYTFSRGWVPCFKYIILSAKNSWLSTFLLHEFF